MKIKFLRDFVFDGKRFKKGEVVEFDEKTARVLKNRGVAEEDKGKKVIKGDK